MRADTRLPPYLPYPRFLLQADLTQTAKLLYALLLGSVIAPVVYLAVCLVLLIIICALMWRYLAHGGSTRFARLQSD